MSSQPAIRRSKSLYEQVYKALRTSILSGELSPGGRLVETQLADWLQVSRTPLREALRQLQQDGLVKADTNGGLRVTTISAEDAAELYDCRLALEQVAVVGACQHATLSQIKQLESFVTQAEDIGQKRSVELDFLQLLDLDYQFHHLIAESSSNRRLVSLLDQLFDAMALLRIQTLRLNPGVLDIRLEHRQIFEAIASRNSTGVITAIKSHLVASKERVTREIEASQREI
nr:GntR family transcriptional regulator [Pseudanabaena sp. FACHB-2040]